MQFGNNKSPRAHREKKSLQFVKDERGVVYTADGKTLYASSNKMSGQYTVKDGTERIRCKAFADNKELTEIVLPESLKSIDKDAFCFLSIETIRFMGSDCRVHPEAIHSCKNLKSVFVPKGSAENYIIKCPQWKSFIVEYET